jgi:hypothetical protein
MAFVRQGVYQCLTGEYSRHSCRLFGIGHDENGQRLPTWAGLAKCALCHEAPVAEVGRVCSACNGGEGK